jgi:hypothetical protein
MKRMNQIPLAVKLIYSAFILVMVPYYWHAYGPQNFLYFCDVALLITLVGIWRESSLLISMEAVGILLPQMLWLLDIGAHLCGLHLMGMTDYMFDPKYSLFVRALYLFHGWLPILLLWLVFRLGYDRRAIWFQTVLGVSLLLVCYFCFVPPGTESSWRMAVNINYVFGTSETAAQTKMPPLVWLAILVFGIPVLMYLPTHFVLSKIAGRGKNGGQNRGKDPCQNGK